MTITIEHLQARLTAAAARKDQLVADLNAAIGQISTLHELIAEAQAEPKSEEPT